MKSMQDEVMSCLAFVELVTEYLEGTMGGEHKARFEQHMHFCPGCVDYLEQVQVTSRLVQQTAAPEEPPTPETVDQLASVFRRWKQSKGPSR
jgi:predicted anti-sigma-YlaC factor YlaD